MKQGIIDVAPCLNWCALYKVVDTDTKLPAIYLPAILLFPISPVQRSIKNISKHLFQLISSSTKIIEFDNVKFSKRIWLKDDLWREFLEIDSNSTFSKKNEYFKNVNIFNLFSVNKL